MQPTKTLRDFLISWYVTSYMLFFSCNVLQFQVRGLKVRSYNAALISSISPWDTELDYSYYDIISSREQEMPEVPSPVQPSDFISAFLPFFILFIRL